jgi:hypothetical protein
MLISPRRFSVTMLCSSWISALLILSASTFSVVSAPVPLRLSQQAPSCDPRHEACRSLIHGELFLLMYTPYYADWTFQQGISPTSKHFLRTILLSLPTPPHPSHGPYSTYFIHLAATKPLMIAGLM